MTSDFACVNRPLNRVPSTKRSAWMFAAVASLAMAGTAVADVISTFDANDQGWQIVDLTLPSDPITPAVPAVAPVFQAANGNPGGYIEFTDPSDRSFYFDAPAAFLGNRLSSYGADLKYEQFTDPTTPAWRDDPDVILVSGAQALVFQGAANPGLDWTSYVVPLNETAWHKTTLAGAAPSAAEFQAVLSSLTALRIRGEYVAGVVERTGLDNVALQEIPEPNSAALALVAAGFATLARRRVTSTR